MSEDWGAGELEWQDTEILEDWGAGGLRCQDTGGLGYQDTKMLED